MLKTRVFHLQARAAETQQKEATRRLLQLMGVRSVQVFSNRIRVTYNLLEVNAHYVVRELESMGMQLRASWFDKWKWSWVYDMEENALNLLAEPEGACCNKPPAKM